MEIGMWKYDLAFFLLMCAIVVAAMLAASGVLALISWSLQ